MKELVVISGKGGTGKTSITAAIAALAKSKVIVDCDVDAADLHLVLNPKTVYKEDFFGGKLAKIDPKKCVSCGKCIELCSFNAISNSIKIDEIKCEGCGVCSYFCPVGAIKMIDKKSGEWFESDTRFGKLIHAKLGIAEDNSGKLVTKIRNHARLLAKKENAELIIIDGSPGVGCPVIASISGASLVLIVTEPTMSAIHDARRVYELTRYFKIPACMCINKYDINQELTLELENMGIDVVGKVPYSKEFTEAIIKGLTLIENAKSEVSEAIETMWKKIKEKNYEICNSNN